MKLEARADGIYGQVKWSKPGLDLLENAHYKFFSPYWSAEEIPNHKGHPTKIFRPIALISVGLTNQPNLPLLPLANGIPLIPPVQSDPVPSATSDNPPLPHHPTLPNNSPSLVRAQ